jgi:hypothetical protein
MTNGANDDDVDKVSVPCCRTDAVLADTKKLTDLTSDPAQKYEKITQDEHTTGRAAGRGRCSGHGRAHQARQAMCALVMDEAPTTTCRRCSATRSTTRSSSGGVRAKARRLSAQRRRNRPLPPPPVAPPPLVVPPPPLTAAATAGRRRHRWSPLPPPPVGSAAPVGAPPPPVALRRLVGAAGRRPPCRSAPALPVGAPPPVGARRYPCRCSRRTASTGGTGASPVGPSTVPTMLVRSLTLPLMQTGPRDSHPRDNSQRPGRPLPVARRTRQAARRPQETPLHPRYARPFAVSC